MSDPFEAPPKLLLSEHVKGSTLNLRHKVSASAYAHLNPDQFNMELLLRNGGDLDANISGVLPSISTCRAISSLTAISPRSQTLSSSFRRAR
jgi:hypothetical protein